MQKFLFVAALFMATGLLSGCSGDPGEATPPTKEELQNDPATKEPGGV